MMPHSNFSKILLGLDGSPYAQAAIEYACQLAHNHNAAITGVAIIDRPGIQSSGGPVPIGGAHYDVQLEDKLLEKMQAEAKAILEDFARICDDQKINAILHADTGNPVSEIIEESKFHNFIRHYIGLIVCLCSSIFRYLIGTFLLKMRKNKDKLANYNR